MQGFDRRGWAYRADIDGLRALAVCAVVLSHLRIEWMGGGYVGVDMFFVISGYVVFGDLLRRAEAGNASALAFYVRRVRRLLPNLIAMSIFVWAAGAFLFLPSDFLRLPGRIAGSVLGFSNWLFAYQAGYFEPASEWNPLLHTWTLSVEVQFYLVVPLLVLAAARRGIASLRVLVVGLAITSFGYALFTREPSNPYHFYDTAARAWEFLLGILLHLWRRPCLSHRLANTLTGAALGVLAACFVILRRDGGFPDLRALLPTLSVAILIWALPSATLLRSMLEVRPLVLAGRASYSIYIWHWPLIVFAAYIWPDFEHRPVVLMPLVLSIFALSFAMFRLIEEPLRSRLSERRTWTFMGIAGLALAMLCTTVLVSRGWPERFDEAQLALVHEELTTNPRRGECHRFDLGTPIASSCRFGANEDPTVAVWSDSHGVELIEALEPELAVRNLSAVLLSFSSCPPHLPSRILSSCDGFSVAALEWLVDNPRIETVILAGALDTDSHRGNPNLLRELLRATEMLQSAGKHLLVIYPVPSQRFHVPRSMVNARRFGLDYGGSHTTRQEYLSRNRKAFAAYDQVRGHGVQRIYPHKILCRPDICQVARAGQPLYFDDNHLTLFGAGLLADEVLAALAATREMNSRAAGVGEE